MKKAALILLAFVVVLSGAVFAGQKKSPAEYDRCMKACTAKCDKFYTTCVKDAKTDQAKKSCQKSKELCNSDCVNKACR
jgi:hypothetical protein